MTTRALALTPLLLIGALLAGCGSDDTEEPTATPTSASPTTEDVTDDPIPVSFTFTPPEGWADITDDLSGAVAGFEPLVAYADEAPTEFASNVNVLPVEGLDEASLDDFAAAGISELEITGVTDIVERDRVDVDGTEAAVVTATGNEGGTEYFTHQYLLQHDTGSYVVTFSFGADVPEDERFQVADSTMSTWTWES